ncbi:unnamed protein product, partial [Iphiclides podalirius]
MTYHREPCVQGPNKSVAVRRWRARLLFIAANPTSEVWAEQLLRAFEFSAAPIAEIKRAKVFDARSRRYDVWADTEPAKRLHGSALPLFVQFVNPKSRGDHIELVPRRRRRLRGWLQNTREA